MKCGININLQYVVYYRKRRYIYIYIGDRGSTEVKVLWYKLINICEMHSGTIKIKNSLFTAPRITWIHWHVNPNRISTMSNFIIFLNIRFSST